MPPSPNAIPVLPLVGSMMVAPGARRPLLSASSSIADCNSVLHRPDGVEVLDLCEDAPPGPERFGDVDKRRVPNKLVYARVDRRPKSLLMSDLIRAGRHISECSRHSGCLNLFEGLCWRVFTCTVADLDDSDRVPSLSRSRPATQRRISPRGGRYSRRLCDRLHNGCGTPFLSG